ncbi:MAG: molybdopterin converting factor subunit 1 [Pseudomonadota bacterium]
MKLVYFAWIRERIGREHETVELPPEVATVSDLLTWLKSRGDEYMSALEKDDIVQVAVDHQHVADRNTAIGKASEIALFPPMTGG